MMLNLIKAIQYCLILLISKQLFQLVCIFLIAVTDFIGKEVGKLPVTA